MGYQATNKITQTTPMCLRDCFWGIIFERIFKKISHKSPQKNLLKS